MERKPLNNQVIQLKGKCALVMGGSAGLGASVCRQLAADGMSIALNCAHSKDRAEQFAADLRRDYSVKVVVIRSDIFTHKDAAEKLVVDSHEALGGLDIVVSNAGWTKIIPYDDLDALDDKVWDGCFGANVKTHFFLFRKAKQVFDQSPEGGTFIVSASVAARMVFGSSIPHAVSKAALIHLVTMLAKSQGPKIRVHAIRPELLLTDWGQRLPGETIQKSTDLSPIKEIPDVDETAAHFVFLCKMATSTGTISGADCGISL